MKETSRLNFSIVLIMRVIDIHGMTEEDHIVIFMYKYHIHYVQSSASRGKYLDIVQY